MTNNFFDSLFNFIRLAFCAKIFISEITSKVCQTFEILIAKQLNGSKNF